MYVCMGEPPNSLLSLAASSVFSDFSYQVVLIIVDGGGLDDLSAFLDLRAIA